MARWLFRLLPTDIGIFFFKILMRQFAMMDEPVTTLKTAFGASKIPGTVVASVYRAVSSRGALETADVLFFSWQEKFIS